MVSWRPGRLSEYGLPKRGKLASKRLEEFLLDGKTFSFPADYLRLVVCLTPCRGFSQAFYREKLYETYLGYSNLEDFVQNFFEKWSCSKGENSSY